MDKRVSRCLASLARVEYWADTGTTGCPFCGTSWKDRYGQITVVHEDDCPVKLAGEVLVEEGIFF